MAQGRLLANCIGTHAPVAAARIAVERSPMFIKREYFERAGRARIFVRPNVEQGGNAPL